MQVGENDVVGAKCYRHSCQIVFVPMIGAVDAGARGCQRYGVIAFAQQRNILCNACHRQRFHHNIDGGFGRTFVGVGYSYRVSAHTYLVGTNNNGLCGFACAPLVRYIRIRHIRYLQCGRFAQADLCRTGYLRVFYLIHRNGMWQRYRAFAVEHFDRVSRRCQRFHYAGGIRAAIVRPFVGIGAAVVGYDFDGGSRSGADGRRALEMYFRGLYHLDGNIGCLRAAIRIGNFDGVSRRIGRRNGLHGTTRRNDAVARPQVGVTARSRQRGAFATTDFRRSGDGRRRQFVDYHFQTYIFRTTFVVGYGTGVSSCLRGRNGNFCQRLFGTGHIFPEESRAAYGFQRGAFAKANG